MMPLPRLLAVTDIHERLQAIFPDETASRYYVTQPSWLHGSTPFHGPREH